MALRYAILCLDARPVNYPPPPAEAKLLVEEVEDALIVRWQARGGESRRKLRVLLWGGVLLLQLGGVLIWFWAGMRLSLPNLICLSSMLWALFSLARKRLLPLAERGGDAELRLQRAEMQLDAGGGIPVRKLWRTETVPPDLLPPSSSVEGTWIREVLARWRSGTLFSA